MVGEPFLDDAVGGQFDAVSEPPDRPADLHLDGDTGAADPGSDRIHVAEAGLRFERWFGRGRAADDAEHAAGLGEGTAPGSDDRLERLRGFGGPVAAQRGTGALRLDDHHAERVSDDVVQLAGDSFPFGGGSSTRSRCLISGTSVGEVGRPQNLPTGGSPVLLAAYQNRDRGQTRVASYGRNAGGTGRQ